MKVHGGTCTIVSPLLVASAAPSSPRLVLCKRRRKGAFEGPRTETSFVQIVYSSSNLGIVSWHREKKEVAKKVNSKMREDRGVSMLLDRLPKGVRHGHQDWPLGGKLEARIVPDSKTRTNVSEFKPAQSPLHFSSFSRPPSSRRSGIQNPARNSRCSESIIWVNLSSSVLGGLPFRLCAFKLASSSSSRCM
jgi:hypothetical protein